jgi:hypothetical protein
MRVEKDGKEKRRQGRREKEKKRLGYVMTSHSLRLAICFPP